MELVFKKFEREEGTLTSLGTVESIVGVGGILGLEPKNFKNPNKRVVVVLEKADGTSTMITCSTQVSTMLRDKSITLAEVKKFEVLHGDAGVHYISLPGGAGLVKVAIADLVEKDFVVTSTMSYEELIA